MSLKSRNYLCRAMLAVLALVYFTTNGRSQTFLGKNAATWEQELKQGKDDRARRSAAFALGKLGSVAFSAGPALQKALSDDKSASVREAAALALGEIGRTSLKALDGPDLVTALSDALTKDRDSLVRRSAALALGKFGSDASSALAALVSVLGDPAPEVRQNAAWALGHIGPKAVGGLRKALADADPLVKRDAAGALGRLANREEDFEQVRTALPELINCCQEKNSQLRNAALGVLNKIVNPDDTKLAAAIRQALTDSDLEVRQNAALTLANIGGAEAAPALPILADALKNGDPELRQQAAAALGNIGPPAASAIPQLIEALATPDKDLRRNAAYALGGIGDKAEPAIPALVRLLASPDDTVKARIEAAVALSKIGPQRAAEEAVPTIVKVLEDPKTDAKVRERVVWSLRVHKLNLANFPSVYPAFAKILSESKNPETRMLRYDCAYMLGVLQAADAPKEALDVLSEFLKDETILIFKGKAVQTGTTGAEANQGKAGLIDEGTGDGRVMAIQALKRIGAARVIARTDIVQQLRALAANPKTLPDLKEKTKELLTDLGK